MSVRPIAAIGDPVLRRPTLAVSLEDLASPEIQDLIDDLIETMRDANGAGLAANQVSVPLRIAVMEVTRNPRYPYKPAIPLTVTVNPVLSPVGDDKVEINEGCLSVPLRGSLWRHTSVRVEYLNRNGEPRDEVKTGLTAGTFQHEIDHLDGKLIVDRTDSRSLATWEQYERHQKDEFVERITRFADRMGS